MDDTARDVCQSILEELRTALSEIRESPTLRRQLRADAQTLLMLEKGEGPDAALHRFHFSVLIFSGQLLPAPPNPDAIRQD
jgi:hypothetical protein